MRSDMRRLLSDAKRRGCRVEFSGSGHVVIYAADGKRLTTVSTSPTSEHIAFVKTRSILRRAGIV